MIFLLCPVALTIVLAIQALNPFSKVTWHRPSWSANPFTFGDPIQLFHLTGFICLAQGIVTTVRGLLSPEGLFVEAAVPAIIGFSVLIGVKIMPVIFKLKFEAAGA